MTYAKAVADGIWAAGTARVGYIPSVSVAPVVNSLVATDGGTDGVSPRVTPLSREEEAIGVMGAVAFTGGLGYDETRHRCSDAESSASSGTERTDLPSESRMRPSSLIVRRTSDRS